MFNASGIPLKAVLTIALFAAGAVAAFAETSSFQGFEAGTGDWQSDNGTSPIQVVPSGTNGINAAGGSNYAVLTNQPDAYSPGYGSLGYSFFGFATNPPFEGNFYQSIDVYIDAAWPAASANNNGQAFWIDMSPSNPDPNNYGAEHNFRIAPTASGVQVSVDGQGSPITTLTTSGWYDFEMTYEAGALNSLVTTNMNVYDLSNNLLGNTTVVANSPGGPLLSQNLQGPGYVWLTLMPDDWQVQTLAIDNVQTDLLPTPEPASFFLLGTGLLLLALARRRGHTLLSLPRYGGAK